MYISLNWLKDFVTIPKGITPEKLANDLTLKTAEVESVSQGGKGLEGVVVGELLEIKKHPDADKLNLAKVDIGKAKPLELIFGSMLEMKVGYRVPVAVAPTTLPTGMIIEKRELRGQPSEGMLCLDQELGFKKEGVSIQFFPKTIKPGTPLAEALGLDDTILEFDNKSLTHRPDLWGTYGIAREISAIYGTPLKTGKTGCNPDFAIPKKGKTVPVEIKNYKLCHRYCGVLIKNVKVQPSPAWMQKRLKATGHQIYNNIVDVTNYVSAEIGKPIHSFDEKLIEGGIIIRNAKKGEKIKALDGKTYTLTEEMLLIADHKKPVAIGGIIGGDNSSVTEKTTNVIIESAIFDGAALRRTAAILGLRTDAVQKFEKQLDPTLALTAAQRAAELILEVSPGAYIAGPITDIKRIDETPRVITFDLARANSKIGIPIKETEVKEILKRLGFKVADSARSGARKSSASHSGASKKTLEITVPSFRAQKDVSTEDDLVEEIARIHGYGNIPPVLPKLPTKLPIENTERFLKHDLRKLLTLGLGFDEIMTYSFYSKKDLENCGLNEGIHVQIENFLSEDQTHMRTSLVPNLLKKIYFNSKYLDEFRLFEIGRTYNRRFSVAQTPQVSRASASFLPHNSDEYFPLEEKWIAGAVVTKVAAAKDPASANSAAFYEAKGAVIAILRRLMLPPCKFVKDVDVSYAHPVASAIVMTFKGETLGRIFTLHPQVAKAFDLDRLQIAMFELNYSLLSKIEKVKVQFSELPKFPPIIIDVSVVTDETTTIETLQKAITSADKHLIQDVTLFDLYKGETIGKGKKSATFKVVLQTLDRTLTDEEMKQVQEKIFANLKTAGGTIRGL